MADRPAEPLSCFPVLTFFSKHLTCKTA